MSLPPGVSRGRSKPCSLEKKLQAKNLEQKQRHPMRHRMHSRKSQTTRRHCLRFPPPPGNRPMQEQGEDVEGGGRRRPPLVLPSEIEGVLRVEEGIWREGWGLEGGLICAGKWAWGRMLMKVMRVKVTAELGEGLERGRCRVRHELDENKNEACNKTKEPPRPCQP